MKKLSVVLLLLVFTVVAADDELPEMIKNREFKFVSDPVWSTPAKSQGWTGTCWSFSTTSFIESEAYRITGKKYELSEMFTAFNMYLEKAFRYVRLWGNNNFDQGGLSHDFYLSVPKYGIVRDSDFSGLLEGQNRHNHREMVSELKDYLKEKREKKDYSFVDTMKADLAAIMTKHIGAVPEEIEVDGQMITPVTFAANVLKFNPDDYIEITSYKYLTENGRGELLVPDNWLRYEGYYNVSLDDFITIMDHALKTGYSFVIDTDVSEKTRSKEYGIFWMPQDINGTKVTVDEREEMFMKFSTTDDHLMHVTGLATDQDGIKYYYTKDSGGEERYPYKGFAYMSENWFRGKVLAIFLHKDALTPEMAEKLGL